MAATAHTDADTATCNLHEHCVLKCKVYFVNLL